MEQKQAEPGAAQQTAAAILVPRDITAQRAAAAAELVIRPLEKWITLRILTLATGIGCFFLGATITFAIIRAIEMGSPELAFVVGAVLGTQIAAIVHHRQTGSANSFVIKVALGAALAVAAVVFGVTIHFAFSPFKYAEVSVPIAAIGSFIFPFVLFDTMWKALFKAKDG